MMEISSLDHTNSNICIVVMDGNVPGRLTFFNLKCCGCCFITSFTGLFLVWEQYKMSIYVNIWHPLMLIWQPYGVLSATHMNNHVTWLSLVNNRANWKLDCYICVMPTHPPLFVGARRRILRKNQETESLYVWFETTSCCCDRAVL